MSFFPDSESRGTQRSKAMKFDQEENLPFSWALDEQVLAESVDNDNRFSKEEKIDLRVSSQYWDEVLSLFATGT